MSNIITAAELETYARAVDEDLRSARRLVLERLITALVGRTVERTETHNYVPMIEGRSSIGRLGLFVHVTAGFGDVGFCGYWTLEMFAVQPVKIYPGVQICQLFFHQIVGDITEYSSAKYQHNRDIQPSMLFRELDPDAEEDPQLRLSFGADRGVPARAPRS